MQVFSLLRPSQCCFTAILLLAASGLWLYNFLAPLPLCFGLPHSLSTYPSVVHSVQDAVLLHPSSLKSIGLPFGNEHFSPNFSLPLPSTVHSHRKRTLDFNTAVCTGQKLWKMIQDEYATPNPATSGRVFNYDDIDNGWTITHNAAIGPDGTWNTVFPSNPHFRYISMEQDRYFRNKFGKLTRVRIGLSTRFSFDIGCVCDGSFPCRILYLPKLYSRDLLRYLKLKKRCTLELLARLTIFVTNRTPRKTQSTQAITPTPRVLSSRPTSAAPPAKS